MKKTVVLAVFLLGFIVLPMLNCYAETGISSVGGEYFLVGSRSCAYVNNYQDFGANFSLPNSGGTTRTGHYQGHLNLNKDGTGSFETRFVQYYHQSINPGQIPVAFYDETCDISYEQLPNRLRLNLSNCFSTTTAGFAIGTQWVVADTSLTFGISSNGDVLLLSNTGPVVERTWQPVSPSLVIERVCSRSLTAIRQIKDENEQ